MRKISLFSLLPLLLTASSLSAQETGSLPVPILKTGQFVYVVPENFDPPLIGPAGLEAINQAAQKLHFPFYTVIVERLSGFGDGDRLAAEAIDGLAQSWAERYQNFDVAKSQIFLLAYEPRKYRFLAGAKFKTELGFEREAHRPYIRIFESYTQGTPKDPGNGIIAMMAKVDEYLFDQTDPVKIAARQEVARLAEEKRRQLEAESALDAQIFRLSGLLEEKSYLPQNISGYQSALEKAKHIRNGGDRQVMLEATVSLQKDTGILENYVKTKRREARITAVKTFSVKLFYVLVVGSAALFFWSRRRRLIVLRKSFNSASSQWQKKIANAANKYLELYGERRSILELAGNQQNANALQGKTKELYERTTAEIDAIYTAGCALESHIEKKQQTAAHGSFFNLKPLRSSLNGLGEEFEFDTGEMNQSKLFGEATKRVKVIPAQFEKELEARFENSVNDWNWLKKAADCRYVPAEKLFPHDKLNALLSKVDKCRVPRRWLNDHPLFGDDIADQNFYEGLNAVRNADPVDYLDRIEEAEKLEKLIEERLGRLTKALEVSYSKRLEVLPSIGDIVLDPDDDPSITFGQARCEEDKLVGYLASEDSLEKVEEKAKTVFELYQKCIMQTAVLKNAKSNSEKAMAKTEKARQSAYAKRQEAVCRLKAALLVHAKVNAEDYIKTGDSFRASAENGLNKSRNQYNDGRYLNSARNADRAAEQVQKAEEQYAQAVKNCDDLDRKKAEYESRLAEMEKKRKQYQKKINEYGGMASLPKFTPPLIDSVVDYLILLAILNQQENSWHDEERQARTVYEAEQTRLEEERRREERRRREEERRQQDSSSGDSWGSGGGSSFGGSWGRGGSSSSGGSW